MKSMEKKCMKCGASFRYAQGENKRNRCDKCRSLKCEYCGNQFVPENRNYKSKYCGRKCKDASQKGKEPKHLTAKRGIKPRTYHITNRAKHGSQMDRDWRTAVFLRDKYTCQKCGIIGKRLQAHHLKPFKQHPELRHDVSNGQTLCLDCHRTTETYGGKNAKRK
jgi:hypothetical protein